MRFRAILALHGKTATGIEVPREVVEALGGGKRPAVRVTLADHTYRTTVASRGDRFLLPVSAENRSAAGLQPGDEVDVAIDLDTEPREVIVPPDLADALAADPAARSAFDALSYTRRKEHAHSITSAKTTETRQRRLEKVLASLR